MRYLSYKAGFNPDEPEEFSKAKELYEDAG
jgi:hypothetical protein